VAVGADFQADPALVGRTSLERVSARAMNLNWPVGGVNSWLRHDLKIPFLQFTQFTLDSERRQFDSSPRLGLP
jgi:hypothetical protein